MVVPLTSKNDEDPIKNEEARLLTTLYIDFSDAQAVSGGILQKLKFIEAFIVVLVTCKKEGVLTTFLIL